MDGPRVSVPKPLSVRAEELTVVRIRIRKEPDHVLAGAVVRITGPGFVRPTTTNATGEAIFPDEQPTASALHGLSAT